MSKNIQLFFCTLTLALLSLPNLHAEDVNLSTYYPSPYGSYKRLSIEDVGADANVYGSLQVIREAAGHLGSHIAFIREGVSRMGLGYEQSSDTFGFGPAANATTTAFQPTLLAIDATGEVGIGTNNPSARLHATTENATTNTVTDILRMNHSSTNIPTTNFGTGLLFTGQSSLVNNRNMARIQSVWTDAADGTRTSSLQFQTTDNAGPLTTQMTIDGVGNVGIGTDTPAASAILDVTSPNNDKGFLVPRMTQIQRTSIISPATGLLVYQTNGSRGFYYFDGAVWMALGVTSGLPAPDYDSGWISGTGAGWTFPWVGAPAQHRTLTHSLGTLNTLVQIEGRDTGVTTNSHQLWYGGEILSDGSWRGIEWFGKTVNNISLRKGNVEDRYDEVRVLMWRIG